MKTILKWLAKLNQWYENRTEQKRFLIAVLFGLFPFMFFSGLAAASKESFIYIPGFLWMVLMMAYRGWWLYGNLRSYLDAKDDDKKI